MTLNRLFPDGETFTASDVLSKLRESELNAANERALHSAKATEEPGMYDLREFCKSGRNPNPTKTSTNKKLKGIANGPTNVDLGISTLRSEYNSDTGKIRFHIEFELDEITMDLDKVDPADWSKQVDVVYQQARGPYFKEVMAP
jgi:hypothetical protein